MIPPGLDLATLIGKIEAHLAEHPDDGKGFELLAPIYLRFGRYEDALRARSEAMRLLGETPDRLADLAEARMAASGGVVTRERPRRSTRRSRSSPSKPRRASSRRSPSSRTGGAKRLSLPYRPCSPMRRPTRLGAGPCESRLARLTAPSGGEAAAIAGLPPAAQGDAIRSMVEGLAARLKQQGGSAEEWARLVRSYAVLGETEKSRAALADARAALPDEASRATLLEVARASGLEAGP